MTAAKTMIDGVRIHLSGEPIGKGRPRFQRATGRTFTPERTRQYEGVLRLAAQEEMGHRSPLDGPLRVELYATFAVPKSWSKKRREAALAQREWPTKKPDADNLLKVIDALNGVVV